jgi:hypothetical protein
MWKIKNGNRNKDRSQGLKMGEIEQTDSSLSKKYLTLNLNYNILLS